MIDVEHGNDMDRAYPNNARGYPSHLQLSPWRVILKSVNKIVESYDPLLKPWLSFWESNTLLRLNIQRFIVFRQLKRNPYVLRSYDFSSLFTITCEALTKQKEKEFKELRSQKSESSLMR